MKRIMTAVFAVAFATSAFAADGAALYKSKCAMCHGADAKGGKMMPKAIAGMSQDTVKKTITEGKGKMKPVSSLSPEDAAAVASYVSGLSK